MIKHGTAQSSLSGKRSAASAGAGGVGVAKLEAAAIDAGDEIDDRAFEKGRALGIDVDFDSVPFPHGIFRPLLFVEIKLVRKTRATAVGHPHAQTIPGLFVPG